MLKLKQESILKRKFKGLCFKLFNTLENNNNPHFNENGESMFLKMLLSSLPKNEATIFDVGSNLGIYIQAVLNYSETQDYQPKIYSFETDQKLSKQTKTAVST